MIEKIIAEIQAEVDKLDVTNPTQNGIAEGLLTAKRLAEQLLKKPKLSDIEKVNCKIFCGTNEKLLDLLKQITTPLAPGHLVWHKDSVLILWWAGKYCTTSVADEWVESNAGPSYKIEEIEL